MDFRQLETFVAVAKLKSFSKAAKKLFLTQPTVTSHIQNLENQLGTILLNRSGKNVTLTEAGNILYAHALNILSMRDRLKFDIGSYEGKVQGHLEISSSSMPRQYILPNILKDFSKLYPDVTFSILDNDSKSVVKNILDGNIDFGIVGAKHNSKYLEYLDLMEDNLVLVLPNTDEYSINTNGEVDKDFLLSKKILLREEGSGTRFLVEQMLKQNGLNIEALNIIAFIEDTETIKRSIELNLGIGFISEKAVSREVDAGLLKTCRLKDISLKRNFYFVYHKGRQLSPLTGSFKDFMVHYIKQNSHLFQIK